MNLNGTLRGRKRGELIIIILIDPRIIIKIQNGPKHHDTRNGRLRSGRSQVRTPLINEFWKKKEREKLGFHAISSSSLPPVRGNWPREIKKKKKERKKYPIGRFYKLIVNNVPEHIVPQIPDLIMWKIRFQWACYGQAIAKSRFFSIQFKFLPSILS